MKTQIQNSTLSFKKQTLKNLHQVIGGGQDITDAPSFEKTITLGRTAATVAVTVVYILVTFGKANETK